MAEIDENLYLFSLPILRGPLEAILQNSSATTLIENGQNFTDIDSNATFESNMTESVILLSGFSPINLSDPTTIQLFTDRPEIQWRHPLLALLMVSFCITTVAGNCLVVAAVCTKRYLRNPTGYLIVSLAFADLIVGLIVMPLNSLFEMTRHVWILGLTMCDLFHALDILASTSSIWNLCVISLDRYLAGQDPIGYRDKVSTKRIMIAIFFVWIMSACLSFPAIIWWRKTSPHLYTDQSQCLFTDSRVYVVFSSLVSFYIPLILILYAYGRVYLIATHHARSLKSGMKKMTRRKRNKDSDRSVAEENAPALRIHVGRGKQNSIVGALMNAATANAAVPHRPYGSFYVARTLTMQPTEKNTNGTAKKEKEPLAKRTSSPISRHNSMKNQDKSSKLLTDSTSSEAPLLKPDSTNSSVNTFGANRHKTSNDSNACSMANGNGKSFDRMPSNTSLYTQENLCDFPNGIPAKSQTILRKRLGVREKSRQMMRYVQEQRAARTLSVVVGAFILCWMPFFIISPLVSFCSTCIGNQETVFSVITWAGHLNSMLNPLIYSRFSRDFRRAFKQILTCQHRNRTKLAFKTPLSVVFAQLVSITHLWETTQTSDCQST